MRTVDPEFADTLADFCGTPRKAFFGALEAENISLVRDVLKHHPDAVAWRTIRDDLQAEDDFGLHIAARLGSLELAKLLLDAGAQVNARNVDGESPVMEAIRHHQEEVVRHLLVEAKANPNHRCGSGETPLMVAAAEGFFEGAELLIAQGADVHARAKAGNALIYAVDTFRANEKIISLLVEKGARYDIRNEEGKTALEIARDGRRPFADFLAGCIARREEAMVAESRAAQGRDIAAIHSGIARTIAVKKPLRLRTPGL